METISILGCGWLGLPLAHNFIHNGYKVKGSTTSPGKINSLKGNRIDPFIVTLTPLLNSGTNKFFNADVLIINIPPNNGDDKVEYHKKQIESIKTTLDKSSTSRVIFVSSTSVYNECNSTVVEEDAVNPESISGKALLAAENILFRSRKFKTTIIRFGGLIGEDRNPGKFLAGRINVTGGNTPVNIIHRDDCIEIIFQVIKQDVYGEVFNAVADEHPTKKEFYTKAALSLNLEPPQFNNEKTNYKIVVSSKLKQKLGYKFIHPDPMKIV
ncbi:MAG: SDR family oxidoreductase [Ignavibacteriaceae bacterium]|nr:SDR family oxidoreductase [Ignavibacteriaceae bacterium]